MVKKGYANHPYATKGFQTGSTQTIVKKKCQLKHYLMDQIPFRELLSFLPKLSDDMAFTEELRTFR